MNRNCLKGIIFDMDNTLLQSRIDFHSMKDEVFSFLVKKDIVPPDLPIDEHTTSTLIEEAKHSTLFNGEIDKNIWRIVAKHELAGMEGAKLEPGVIAVLKELHNKLHLTVLTNNSYEAAYAALRNNFIEGYFDVIAGREQATALKPSPAGIKYILDKYTRTQPDNWISIGDSWIDGKAAQDAGVEFINYKGDVELMNRKGVVPMLSLHRMADLLDYLKARGFQGKPSEAYADSLRS